MKRTDLAAGSGLLKAARRSRKGLPAVSSGTGEGEPPARESSGKKAAESPLGGSAARKRGRGAASSGGAAPEPDACPEQALPRGDVPRRSGAKGGGAVPLRIIGVDPGLASTGWGVLEFYNGRLRYIAHGCIETGTDMPRGGRLLFIYKNFLNVLESYKPAQAAVENLYFGRNVSSALTVAEARGILLMAITIRGIPVLELTPNAIKKAVVGLTKADKGQVQEMVRFLLGLKEIPEPDHAADALGAAICAAHTGSLRLAAV